MGKRFKQTCHQEDMQIENKCMKIYSTSLAIRGIQIKSTLTYQYTAYRMATIKQIDNTKCWWGYGATKILIHYW